MPPETAMIILPDDLGNEDTEWTVLLTKAALNVAESQAAEAAT